MFIYPNHSLLLIFAILTLHIPLFILTPYDLTLPYSPMSTPTSDVDANAAEFLTDFGIEATFTKVLIILVLLSILVRLCYIIIRRVYIYDSTTVSVLDNVNDVEAARDQNEIVNRAVTIKIVDFEEEIKSCPSFTYNEKVEAGAIINDTTCPICLSEYIESESEMMRMMPQCGHYFHLKCLDEWLKINWSCPVCRDSPMRHMEQRSCS